MARKRTLSRLPPPDFLRGWSRRAPHPRWKDTYIWAACPNAVPAKVAKINVATGLVEATVSIADAISAAFDGTYLWVASYVAGTLVKVDPVTNAVLTSIACGAHPHYVTFDGTYLWVANYTSSTVTKINPLTGVILSTVTVGANPIAALFDGTSVWVTNSGGDSLSKINPTTATVTATIALPGGTAPYGLAFDGTCLWVTGRGADNVKKINITTNTVVTTVAVGVAPWGVTFDGVNIWVANQGATTVSKIDPVGATVLATVTAGNSPLGVVFDGNNSVWAGIYDAAAGTTVVKINIDYNKVTKTTTGVPAGPYLMLAQTASVVQPATPTPVVYTEFAQTYTQGFRIEDTSLELYELYVGVGGPPDYDASGQPVATSATLPFSWTPPAGPVTLHIVVRKKNRYALESFNVYETIKVIDAVGVELMAPVSIPRGLVAYDAATGYLNVVAKYVSSEDPSPADTWELYVKFGSDPVPGVDTPVYTGAMVFAGRETGLGQVVGPYTPGDVAHVVAVAFRTADGARGATPVLLKTLANLIDLTEGFVFGGNAFEQR